MIVNSIPRIVNPTFKAMLISYPCKNVAVAYLESCLDTHSSVIDYITAPVFGAFTKHRD